MAFVCFCAFDGSEICLPNRIFSNFSMDTGDPEISTQGMNQFYQLQLVPPGGSRGVSQELT